MKTNLLILITTLFFVQTKAQNAELIWVKQIGGVGADEAQAITMDAANHMYTTGYFSNTVDFDPGPGIVSLTSIEDEDVFISKMDSAGNLIWVKQFGGIRYQSGLCITIDDAGNVYTGGIFFGLVDFDPGPGTNTLQSSGQEDAFICKLNADGDFVWAKKVGGISTDRINSISLDSSGGLIITGYFTESGDFNPGPGILTLTSNGVADIFVLKLTVDGSFLWVKQIGGISYDAAFSIKTDQSDNIYICGFFLDMVDFNPGPGVSMLNSFGDDDVFVLKLDNNGNFKWVKQIGGTLYDRASSINIDINGDVIIAGYFDGTCDFDPGPGTYNISALGFDDTFIAKLDSNGIFKWARSIEGTSLQRPYTVVTDYSGDIYTVGYFDGLTDFDPDPGVYNLTSVGFIDVFVSKLDINGDFVWAKQFGGDQFESGYSVYVDQVKNVFTTGFFRGTVDFDPNAGLYNLTSFGSNDIFIHKMRQCPTVSSLALQVSTCNSYILNNQVYTASGNYMQVLKNADGCDSLIINLELTITRIFTDTNAAICNGESYLAGGVYQTVAGTYYDTLINSMGCDSVIATHLSIKPGPEPNLGPDRNLCFGETQVLDPGIFSNYLWHDMSTGPSFNINSPGTYWVSSIGTNQCRGIDTVHILAMDTLPAGFLKPTVHICPGNSFQVTVPGYKDYLWSDQSTAESLTISRPGIYYLTVTDHNNCRGTDSTNVVRITCIPVGIPNSFTPNGDSKNDIFRPTINQTIQNFYFVVFNRLGQKVFETREYGEGWDGRFKGKIQAVGTYVYHIKFVNSIGWESVNNGTVLLIR